MSTPHITELPLDVALLLPDLPSSICQEIAQLANPNGPRRLSEERLQVVSLSLDSSCKRLKARMAHATRTESQQLMQMHEALKAAHEVIALLHQPD